MLGFPSGGISRTAMSPMVSTFPKSPLLSLKLLGPMGSKVLFISPLSAMCFSFLGLTRKRLFIPGFISLTFPMVVLHPSIYMCVFLNLSSFVIVY